jgi:PEP-CTERM motif
MKEMLVWAVITLGVLAISSELTPPYGQLINVIEAQGKKDRPPPPPPPPPPPTRPRHAPEAATLVLAGLGATAVLGWSRWKKNRKAG